MSVADTLGMLSIGDYQSSLKVIVVQSLQISAQTVMFGQEFIDTDRSPWVPDTEASSGGPAE